MARTAASDPLEKFRFEVYILTSTDDAGNQVTDTETATLDPGTAIGFATVQLPKLTTNKITYREGDNLVNVSSLSPGLSSTEDISLTKGITKGKSTLYDWASSIHSGGDTTADFNYIDGNKAATEPDINRKHLRIVMKDRTGKWAKVWDIYNAFPVQFTPGSDLDASADDAKSIESLTIAYESFVEKTVNTDGTGVE